MRTPVRVALIGLGLIGRERLQAIQALRAQGRGVAVAGVLDPDLARAREAEEGYGVTVASSLEALVAQAPDWFVVATPHDTAAGLVPELVRTGAKILVEKPLGRNLTEAEAMVQGAAPGQVWVGLNYRFFAGVSALLEDVRSGWFGAPVAIEALVGHGGAPGMERGWKLDPVRAGGGALIDPGIHLLDLALLLAGEPLEARAGTAWQGFWNTGIEEECHLLLSGRRMPVANLRISIVRWRSTFRLEFHGEDGYGVVEGRGRSYGPQTYRRGRRWGWRTAGSQAESEEVVVESSGDDVFTRELDALLLGTAYGSVRPCGAPQAVEGMRLLEACRAVSGLQPPP